MTVLRRFSDFLGLHEKLALKYIHLGRIVPPAPEKSVIGNYFNLIQPILCKITK